MAVEAQGSSVRSTYIQEHLEGTTNLGSSILVLGLFGLMKPLSTTTRRGLAVQVEGSQTLNLETGHGLSLVLIRSSGYPKP